MSRRSSMASKSLEISMRLTASTKVSQSLSAPVGSRLRIARGMFVFAWGIMLPLGSPISSAAARALSTQSICDHSWSSSSPVPTFFPMSASSRTMLVNFTWSSSRVGVGFLAAGHRAVNFVSTSTHLVRSAGGIALNHWSARLPASRWFSKMKMRSASEVVVVNLLALSLRSQFWACSLPLPVPLNMSIAGMSSSVGGVENDDRGCGGVGMWITVVCWIGGVGTCRLGGVGIGVKSMDDGDDNVSEAVVTGDKGVGSRVVTKSIKGVRVWVGVGLAGTGTGRVSEVVRRRVSARSSRSWFCCSEVELALDTVAA